MVDVIDLIVTFFQLQEHMDLVNKHAVEGPIVQLFYLILFPIIFMLLIVYLVTSKGVISEKKYLKLLVSIAMMSFIIISGYYWIFVQFSEFWFFGLIILGFIYFFWSRGGTDHDDRGGGAQAKGVGAIRGDLFKVIKGKMTGETRRIEQRVDGALKELEGVIDAIEKDPQAWRNYTFAINDARQALAEYEQALTVSGFMVGSGFEKKASKLAKMLERVSKFQRKFPDKGT